jgi:hypothetical protein
MRMIDNIPVYGTSVDEGALAQIKTCAQRIASRSWLTSTRVTQSPSPHRYQRLPEVLAEHGDSIRIRHTLHPLGVAMAGEDVHDPYKD